MKSKYIFVIFSFQCDSVRCTGENVPKREGQVEIDGCVWPIGK